MTPRINELESRQIALSNIIASSDAHASKCSKLGLDFGRTYPDDLKAYKAAIEEYNKNEEELIRLKAEEERLRLEAERDTHMGEEVRDVE